MVLVGWWLWNASWSDCLVDAVSAGLEDFIYSNWGYVDGDWKQVGVDLIVELHGNAWEVGGACCSR